MVLFLLVILVTMGFGFLGSRVGEYQSTAQAALAAQARALARAGIEDARTKFNRDMNFPPPAGVNETMFSYTENLSDVSTPPNYLGFYKVTVDSTFYRGAASGGYYTITSIGGAGVGPAPPGASSWPPPGPPWPPASTHAYRVYLNLNPGVQVWTSPSTPIPPTYFQVVRLDDLGSPTWGNVTNTGL